jgi:hypothetical protein
MTLWILSFLISIAFASVVLGTAVFKDGSYVDKVKPLVKEMRDAHKS